MKSTLKVCIWVALIVSVTLSNAGVNDSQVEVNMIGQKTFNLSLTTEHQGDIQVLLKNKRGNVISDQLLKDGVGTVSFDLNEAKTGLYHLELIDNEEMVLFPVEVTENQVNVKEEEKEIYSFPVVYQKGDLVTVSKWAPEKENINVVILDARKELVHTDRLSGDHTLSKRFDFSYVSSGKYEIQLSCKDQTVKKSVSIK